MQPDMPVSAVAWRPDGTALAVGSSHGRVELHEAFVKQISHGDSFRIMYLTMCKLHVKNLSTGTLLPIRCIWYGISMLCRDCCRMC